MGLVLYFFARDFVRVIRVDSRFPFLCFLRLFAAIDTFVFPLREIRPALIIRVHPRFVFLLFWRPFAVRNTLNDVLPIPSGVLVYRGFQNDPYHQIKRLS